MAMILLTSSSLQLSHPVITCIMWNYIKTSLIAAYKLPLNQRIKNIKRTITLPDLHLLVHEIHG